MGRGAGAGTGAIADVGVGADGAGAGASGSTGTSGSGAGAGNVRGPLLVRRCLLWFRRCALRAARPVVCSYVGVSIVGVQLEMRGVCDSVSGVGGTLSGDAGAGVAVVVSVLGGTLSGDAGTVGAVLDGAV